MGVALGIGIGVGIPLILIFAMVSIYNGLVTSRNRYKNAFSQIDVQLKRRHDLVPNLVETAKGYLAHEQGTLEGVIAARSAAVSAGRRAAADPSSPQAVESLMGAEAALTGALGKLFALQESYPELKASETMQSLMEELTSTENRLAFARQGFNDAVTSYNIDREKFPANLVAGPFNFGPATLWELEPAAVERVAPKVSFG
jgi:LemA protein